MVGGRLGYMSSLEGLSPVWVCVSCMCSAHAACMHVRMLAHNACPRAHCTYLLPVTLRFARLRMHVFIIVLCTSGIKDFVYQRAEGELINKIFNATSA